MFGRSKFDSYIRSRRAADIEIHRPDRTVPLEVWAAPVFDAAHYPEHFELDGNLLQLSYRFDPTDPDDGVTLDLPLPLLGSLPARRLEWLVPGYLQDKLVALLRGLPKELRRELVTQFRRQLGAQARHAAGGSRRLGDPLSKAVDQPRIGQMLTQ